MRGQKTALTGRSPLRWRKFALVCSAIEDDGDGDLKTFNVYVASMGE